MIYRAITCLAVLLSLCLLSSCSESSSSSTQLVQGSSQGDLAAEADRQSLTGSPPAAAEDDAPPVSDPAFPPREAETASGEAETPSGQAEAAAGTNGSAADDSRPAADADESDEAASPSVPGSAAQRAEAPAHTAGAAQSDAADASDRADAAKSQSAAGRSEASPAPRGAKQAAPASATRTARQAAKRPQRTKVAADGRTSNISFDDIKFDMEKDEPFERSMLTPEIEALAGKKIRIRGYILPTSFQTGLKQFVLVRDNMECCFGPGAALYDCIVVDMAEGKTTDYSALPVAVEGTFEIQPLPGFDGKLLAIYHLVADEVE